MNNDLTDKIHDTRGVLSTQFYDSRRNAQDVITKYEKESEFCERDNLALEESEDTTNNTAFDKVIQGANFESSLLNKRKTGDRMKDNTKCKTDLEKEMLDPRGVIEEMKRNYENEISVLKKQLQQVDIQGISSENTLLKRCYMLESQLRRSINEVEALSEQVIGLKAQGRSWPDRIRQIEDENEKLRQRLDDVRANNKEKQTEIDMLYEIVRNLEEKLWNHTSGYSHHDKTLLNRLTNEYNNLLKSFNEIKMEQASNKHFIRDATQKIYILTAQLTESQKSIENLKDEKEFLKRKNFHECFTDSYTHGFRPNFTDIISNMDCNDIHKNGSRLKSIIRHTISPRHDEEHSMNHHNKLSNHSIVSECSTRRLENIPSSSRVNSRSSTLTNEEKENDHLDKTRCSIQIGARIDTKNVCASKQFPGHIISNRDSFTSSDSKSLLGDRKATIDDIDFMRHYEELQNDKKQLLIKLSHIPRTSSARYKRMNKESREGLEAQLDRIERQLGDIRMSSR